MADEVTPVASWWAVFGRNVKWFILEPKVVPRAPQRSSSSASFHSVDNDDKQKPEQVQYEPATSTGFGELSSKTAFAIMLLWLPRFFIPWIAAWHNYDVRFLANPELVKTQERELLIQELILFCGKCGITMFVSFIAGVLNTERSAYMLMLILYTSSPVVGGYVHSVLRSTLIDGDLYSDWLTYVALMRWTMAMPFMFFPLQLTSIFYENDSMSRQAHYNWAGFFAFLEYLNAIIAFWIAPGKCPTTEWVVVAVWIGTGLTLYTVALLTIIFFFVGRAINKELAYCFNSCVYNEEELDGTVETSWSRVLKMTACYLCIFIPVIYATFVFAVLQRNINDDSWDESKSLSATGLFYLGRAVGAALMIVLLTIIRKYGRKITRIRLLRSDVLALGLPHLFIMIALLVLHGRLTTHLNEGIIISPASGNTETVAIFFNLIYRNRTVCVSSEHFRPLRIRPFSHATRTLHNSGSIMIRVTPEPDSIPSISMNYEVKNFSQGEWVAFSITLVNNLVPEVNAEAKLKNYYTKPTVTKLKMDQTRPEKVPQVLMFNTYVEDSESLSYKLKRERQSNQSGNPDISIPANKKGSVHLWRVPSSGNWSVRMETATNKSAAAPWFDFYIDKSHSLYFLVNYWNAPFNQKIEDSAGFHRLTGFKLFKIAELPGPNNSIPSKQQFWPNAAVRTGLVLAGMAAGGVYVGVIYMFWIEPFISTTMRFAILWVLTAVAEEVPKIKLIDMDSAASSVLRNLQMIFTMLHFIGALFLYRPEFNIRLRPD